MEHLTSFVSSRGILKSCDSHNKAPASSSPHLDPELLEQHEAGGSIYVCTEALPEFARRFLPQIRTKFVLVSGDSDLAVDATLIKHADIRSILHNQYLSIWYAQNLAVVHPLVAPLPIGQDYHTMWARPGLWGLTAISPLAQEHTLIGRLRESPPFRDRYLVAYCNWHFALERGDRKQCLEQVDRSVCFFENQPVPRNSTWQRQAECMFVISPEGAGLDCHRTWEALLLGCIPIIKRGVITNLFDNLPVLVVDDWTQVTKDSLLHHAQNLPARTFDFSTLFRDFWMRRISHMPSLNLEPMTHAHFRSFLTRTTG